MHGLLLLLALSPAVAPLQSDTYGKTEAQILAMGEGKWDDFYQAKAGNSTAAMVEMNVIFGAAAEHRNARLAKHVSPPLRTRVEKLRKLISDYAASAIDLGYNITGGGTMWAQVSADISPHAELVLFAILGGKANAVKHATTSAVKIQLQALSKSIAESHADKDADRYFKYAEAKASLAKMRSEFSHIAAAATSLKRADSDRVLGFCIEYAKMASGDWG